MKSVKKHFRSISIHTSCLKATKIGKRIRRASNARNFFAFCLKMSGAHPAENDRKGSEKCPYALVKNPENRTQDERLSMIAKRPTCLLHIAGRAAENQRILHMTHVDVAAHKRKRWIESARKSGLPAMLADKIERHKQNILQFGIRPTVPRVKAHSSNLYFGLA